MLFTISIFMVHVLMSTLDYLIYKIDQTHLNAKRILSGIMTFFLFAVLYKAVDNNGNLYVLIGFGLMVFTVHGILNQTLKDVSAGLIPKLFSAYNVGDLINIQDEIGDIESFGWKNTKLLIDQEEVLLIPNRNIIERGVINYTHKDRARVTLDIKVYELLDLNAVKSEILERNSQNVMNLKKPKPSIDDKRVLDKSALISLHSWVRKDRYNKVRSLNIVDVRSVLKKYKMRLRFLGRGYEIIKN